MELRDLTVEEMADAADELASCLRRGSLEDAAAWVAELYWSLLRHETKRRAELMGVLRDVTRFPKPEAT